MRQTQIALVALLALAVMASGVSAATMTSPLAGDSPSAADTVQPDEYTVDTVDPDDELTDDDIETAREIAWGNETVRASVNADEPVQFEVWAPNDAKDHPSVWVEQNDTTVVADIDLESESVVAVDEPTVLTADNVTTVDTDSSVDGSGGDDSTITFDEATDGTTHSGGASETVTVDGDEFRVIDQTGDE